MIWVLLGAPFGSVLRYLISTKFNSDFPFGTLMINLIGSFLIGVAADWNNDAFLFFGTGLLGSFTTFSTFNVEMIEIFRNSRKTAMIYLLLTFIFGPLLFYVGTLL